MILYAAICGVSVQAQEDPFRANVRPTDPLTPEQEQASFELPEGFEIQLVAAEPDILKPMNLAFDARGRLWVTVTQEYPHPAPLEREGRDAVKILEDTDGDGRADKVTTFAEGLNIPLGILPYRSGVIVYSIPNIWFLDDTDGDGRADQRKKLYGPMGYERDTHGMNNSFRRGFDGWIYACHGFNNETRVSGSDGHEIYMQSGNTYRFRPDGSRIEHFTWGQVNPFGMTFDPWGNQFTADCHSKPIYQLLRGGYYPSFGKPHDGLGFVPPMMDHTHGSTAIAGICFVTGGQFPQSFRQNFYSGNVMTSRVNRNSLQYHGSTILCREEPDLVRSSDPWFRPVDLRIGPDGALYIADFYNRIIGHYEVPLDHPGRDRTSGRIWRVVYRGKGEDSSSTEAGVADLSRASIEQLIAVLGHPNLTRRMLATDQLTDRLGSKCLPAVKQAFESDPNPHSRVQSLWVIHRLDATDLTLLGKAAGDEAPLVRTHAMKVLAETSQDWTTSHRELAQFALRDSNAFVRRAAAEALGQHPESANVRPLLNALDSVPEDDSHLQYMIRRAIRNQFGADEEGSTEVVWKSLEEQQRTEPLTKESRRELAEIARAIPGEGSAGFLLEYLERVEPNESTAADYLRHVARYGRPAHLDRLAALALEKYPEQLSEQVVMLQSIHEGLQQRGVEPSDTIRDWAARVVQRQLSEWPVTDHKDARSQWINSPLEGKPDSANPWSLQSRVAADGRRSQFLSSLPRGEQRTGVLRSADFEIPAKLTFYVAGHSGVPDKPWNGKNLMRLRSATDHRFLKVSPPPRNDEAQRMEWDLTSFAGQAGYLEIVDGDEANGYAWLAVSRFDPPVVRVAKVAPAEQEQQEASAGRLAEQFRLRRFAEAFKTRMVSERSTFAGRLAAARFLLAIEPADGLPALLPLLEDPASSESLRQAASTVLVNRDPAQIFQVLSQAFRSVPQRLQTDIARRLAESVTGMGWLLDAIEQGHASPRLLQNQAILSRLSQLPAATRLELQQEVERLTRGLPNEDQQLTQLLQHRTRQFPSARTSLDRGQAVFTKHCASCHQISGQGATVAPQLDGIGNRGLERVMEDILAPNRNVDVAFRTTSIITEEGQVLNGLFRREEGAQLIFADHQGKEFSVGKDQIEQQKKTHLSLMPENVQQLMNESEFYDLVAFLLTQQAKAPSPEEEAVP